MEREEAGGGAEEEVGGEIMNQRTAVPRVAAVMAVISPRPPGGEITTRVLVGGEEVGEGVDWSELVDCVCRLCVWCCRWVIVDRTGDDGVKAFVDGKFWVVTTPTTTRRRNRLVVIFIRFSFRFAGVLGIVTVSREAAFVRMLFACFELVFVSTTAGDNTDSILDRFQCMPI